MVGSALGQWLPEMKMRPGESGIVAAETREQHMALLMLLRLGIQKRAWRR